MKKTFIFIPPLKKTTGGAAVLLRIADILHQAGRDVALVLREKGRPKTTTKVPQTTLGEAAPAPGDVWLVPEGWPNALAPGLSAGAKCVVYCQNWAYLFSGLPDNVGWRDLPVSFIAVSRPVARYIELALGQKPPVLRPGIDTDHFRPPREKPGLPPVRAAYMPRKNKALAAQIKAFTAARRAETGLEIEWVEIADMDHAGVAEALRSAHVFLATGYPEGCPLPPLEALACGCALAGFSGYGGWDYMRQAAPDAYVPGFALRETPFGGNGFFAPDADVVAAALALEAAASLWMRGGPDLERVLAAGRETAAAYDLERQRRRLLGLWDELM